MKGYDFAYTPSTDIHGWLYARFPQNCRSILAIATHPPPPRSPILGLDFDCDSRGGMIALRHNNEVHIAARLGSRLAARHSAYPDVRASIA